MSGSRAASLGSADVLLRQASCQPSAEGLLCTEMPSNLTSQTPYCSEQSWEYFPLVYAHPQHSAPPRPWAGRGEPLGAAPSPAQEPNVPLLKGTFGKLILLTRTRPCQA